MPPRARVQGAALRLQNIICAVLLIAIKASPPTSSCHMSTAGKQTLQWKLLRERRAPLMFSPTYDLLPDTRQIARHGAAGLRHTPCCFITPPPMPPIGGDARHTIAEMRDVSVSPRTPALRVTPIQHAAYAAGVARGMPRRASARRQLPAERRPTPLPREPRRRAFCAPTRAIRYDARVCRASLRVVRRSVARQNARHHVIAPSQPLPVAHYL